MGVRHRAIRVLALALVASSVVAAHAASLGGLRVDSLGAWTGDGPPPPPPPPPVGCDDFSLPSPTGTDLNGRPVQPPGSCGNATWSVSSGTWTVQNGKARAVGRPSVATLALPTSNAAVSATIEQLGGGREAGLVVSHSSTTGTYLVGGAVGSSRVELRLVSGSSTTVLSAVNRSLSRDVTWRVARTGSTVTVAVDGTTVISYNLTPAHVTTLGSGTGVGMYTTNPAIRFSNLVITT